MTEPADNLARATARSLRARQQLADTLVDIQSRLAPQRLLREGLDELRDAAGEIGRDALDHVRSRPGQAAGIAAALIVFLARDQIADLISAAGKQAVKPLRKRRVTPKTSASPRKDRP
jgi:ElaB/YqjD/DUF883 family membrane-anchored ribosome-binding protein